MEWTLAGLFWISVLLLIFSILRSSHAAKKEQTQIDQIHIATMKEINALQDSVRNIEIDMEVVMKEAGIQLSLEEKLLTREVLDLYRRNYSIDSISEMKKVPVNKIEQILAPYRQAKGEGRKVANAN